MHISNPSRSGRPRQSAVLRSVKPQVLALAVAAAFGSGTVHALPSGAQVVAGQADFSRNGNALVVSNTPGAIINWGSFSVGALESVHFAQQSALSSVLNRVTGDAGSAIYGQLSSNGRVWLINPNGILFGQGSRIDVPGLVASTLNASDDDFRAGRMSFSAGPVAGSIRNEGTLSNAGGGSLYLVAPQIENSGVIRAENGEVLLAAGRQVNLVDGAHPDIQVVVSAAEDRAANLGQILTRNGSVSLLGAVLNQSGRISADRVEVDDRGRIVFRGSQQVELAAGSVTQTEGPAGGQVSIRSAGDTLVSGTVSARGSDGVGGHLDVLGQRVALLDAAMLDASGTRGGGKVRVGGDYQGNNPEIMNSAVTYFGPEARIAVDATEVGAGGTAIVWANDTTRAHGMITARGGALGGDGGFVEVSGKALLHFDARVDTRAPGGRAGTLLLDPTNITVDTVANINGDGTNGDDYLNPGDLDQTTDYGGASSQITATALAGQLEFSSITLAATNDITIGTAVSQAAYGNSLTLNAGANIILNASIDLGIGDLTMTAGNAITQSVGGLTVDALTINAGGNVTLTGTNDANSINATLTGSGSLNYSQATGNLGVTASTVNGALTISGATGANVNVSTASSNLGAVDITSQGNLWIITSATSTSGAVSLAASSELRLLSGSSVSAGTQAQLSGATYTGYGGVTSGGDLSLLANLLGNASPSTLTSTGGLVKVATKTIGTDISFGTGTGLLLPASFSWLSGASGVVIGNTSADTNTVTVNGPLSNAPASLELSGGSIQFNATAGLGTGALKLRATNGGIAQSAGSTITAGSLNVLTSGDAVQLGTENNSISTLYGGTVINGGEQFQLKSVAAGGLTISGAVQTNNGAIDINAVSVQQNANLVVAGTTAGITVTSTGGPIAMGTLSAGNTVTAQTGNGSIDYNASTTLSAGKFIAGTGGVTLTAAGAIVDNNVTTQNVLAGTLQATSTNGVGTGLAVSLDTQVGLMSVSAGGGTGGIDIRNTGNLHINGAVQGPAVSIKTSGDLTIDGTEVGSITTTSGAVTLDVGGNLILSNNGYVQAFTDSSVSLQGAGSTADFSYGGKITTGYGGGTNLTTLNFANRISGGVTIAGIPFTSGTATSGSSGVFYGGSASIPAQFISSTNYVGLNLIYAIVPSNYLVDTLLQSGTASHTYGQTPNAVFGYSLQGGVVAGDSIGGTAQFTPTITNLTPAGTFTVSYLSGLTSSIGSTFGPGAGLSYSVSPATLTASLGGVVSRIYDGTTLATLGSANVSFNGLVGSDTISTGSFAGTYDNKNVGSGKLVSASLGSGNLVAGAGTLLSNYSFYGGIFSAQIGEITPASLSLSGIAVANKVYDGQLSAQLTGAPLLQGVFAGDVVTVYGGEAQFADKNVGDSKLVTLAGFQLAGADAGNYLLSAGASTLSANITQLGSVAWVGGTAGEWSAASNWYGGAIPDGSNVASVSIPSGTTVSYDGLATSLANLTSGGNLVMLGGTLNISNATTAGYQQSGGVFKTGTLTVSQSFSKPGASAGTLDAALVNINQASGDLVFNNNLGVTLGTVTAPGGSVLVDAKGFLNQNGSVTARDRISLVTHSPMTISGNLLAGGDVSLIADSSAANNDNITLNGAVSSTGGNISLNAGDGINQNANISTGGGSVTASAGNGNITMATGTATTSGGGAINYSASSGIQLGLLDARASGPINLDAGDSITSAPGQTGVNLAGGTATINAGGDAFFSASVAAIGGTVGGTLSITNNGTLISNLTDQPTPTGSSGTLTEQVTCLIDPALCFTGQPLPRSIEGQVIDTVLQIDLNQQIVVDDTRTESTKPDELIEEDEARKRLLAQQSGTGGAPQATLRGTTGYCN